MSSLPLTDSPLTARVLTPSGRGAIASIRVSGGLDLLEKQVADQPEHFFVPRNGRELSSQPINQILFGQWGAEELVACRTSESAFEIHCHGGPAAINRILDDLMVLGVNVTSQNAADSKANSRVDWQTDLSATVVEARTFRTAELIWQQQQAIPFWQELADATARGDDLNPAMIERAAEAKQWLEFGRHLTEPWRVVIGGAPNAGKSSLINALLGYERAIVFDQPGTTRDAVKAETAIEGWPVLLSDTAGHRTATESVEAAGIEIALQLMQSADLAVLLIDRSGPADADVERLLQAFPAALLVFNKCDRPAHADWANRSFGEKPLEISCQSQQGLEQLLTTIAENLVPQLPAENSLVPVSEAQRRCLARCSAANRQAAPYAENE